jgi:hypothetical protein
LAVLVGISELAAAEDKPTTEAGTKTVHASLAAYPNAVITTTDTATGMAVSVEPNGRELKAVDKDGKTIWKVDLLKKWGKPGVGTPVIRHLSIQADKIQVTVGKHMYGEVDIKTGKDQFKGED